MGLMPDIEADARAAVGHLFHRHTTAAPAAARTETTGGPMSLSAELHAFASRLETIGDDAVDVLTRVQSNPETARVLTVLDELTGLNIAPGWIGIVASGLEQLVTRARAATMQPAATAPATANAVTTQKIM